MFPLRSILSQDSDKVTFLHSKDTVIYLKSTVIYNKRKFINSKSLVLLTLKTIIFPFHIPNALINIFPGT